MYFVFRLVFRPFFSFFWALLFLESFALDGIFNNSNYF